MKEKKKPKQKLAGGFTQCLISIQQLFLTASIKQEKEDPETNAEEISENFPSPTQSATGDRDRNRLNASSFW